MNIGFRLCFTQSSVVCPSIFISSMPSVKVRFERSKQHEDRGSIYYRINSSLKNSPSLSGSGSK